MSEGQEPKCQHPIGDWCSYCSSIDLHRVTRRKHQQAVWVRPVGLTDEELGDLIRVLNDEKIRRMHVRGNEEIHGDTRKTESIRDEEE